jgi:hypothetical protein
MHRREFVLSATGILGATTVGSIAYTSASVDRSVTSNVAADSAAVIGLTSGGIGAVTETNGKLTINTEPSANNVKGINADGTFTYGDSANPATTFAFSVTNNDGDTQDLTVALNSFTLPGSSGFTLTFYQSDGTQIGSVSPGGSVSYTGWTASETIYAIVEIDTSGTSDTDSISGNMNFSA